MSPDLGHKFEADELQPFEVAVIGGGIIGLAITCGLLNRGIRVKLYEQAQAFGEVGAGIAFTACAQRCMEQLDPAILEAFWQAGAVPLSSSAGSTDPNDYLRWVDGFNSHPGRDPRWQEPLYELSAGVKGFVAVRRDEFASRLLKLLPADAFELRKRLEDIVDETVGGHGERTGRKVLVFADGTTATVDAVIGCDGIKSKVRELMLGRDNPASYPTYTHVAAYRAVIPMDTAIRLLGERKAKTFNNHVGPGANILHYAISNQTLVNITAFVSDEGEWPDHHKLTSDDGSKAHLQEVFARFNPTIVDLISVLPETLPKWAIFDLAEYPLPAFHSGRVVLAGDAAHASAPQHGAGAGIGMEDALCLVTLLDRVCRETAPPERPYAALEAAFASFDAVRRTRCQWFVNSSRRITDLHQQHEWGDPAKLLKVRSCFEEIKDRSHKIWYFDYEGMLKEAIGKYEELLSRKGA
ncbi:salicylate 1-monooxygenase sala [Colletotrichum navitas]|uniref:Salicylate 1-monooxygenase sala n=1 Tax=Colletotrichum navitas TaxID=681940 RepID=A0AAD8PY33_9PEZI|nr:salicylate 1-monooxygenase sala [Colletotrichum navitas]KAK1590248.1 salicylate 1-monooxygenase sala [Colletotrichum navitas]